MSPVSERRGVDEFDHALNRAAGRRNAAHDAPAAETAVLTAVAHRLGAAGEALPGSVPGLAMDEAFRAPLRARLVRLTPELASRPAHVPAQRGGRDRKSVV